MRLRNLIPFLLVAVALVATGCGGASDSSSGGADTSKGSTKVALVAYSTPQAVYEQAIPAFQKTAAGKDVGLSQSYGASGDQSRAVDAGQKADVVNFSLEPDVTRLVDDGKVGADWKSAPHNGIVSDSVVAFVVRKGNPKNIRTWQDLLKPGIEVVTPNPFQSGGARWNLLAAYGAAGAAKGDPAAGLKYLDELLSKHVKVQDASARGALHTFTQGEGDVLLSYENEAIGAQKAGEDVDYVVPDDTILIETPVAVLKGAPAAANDFVKFLWSDAGQKIFAENGYRPVVKSVFDQYRSKFPVPSGLFTAKDLGGWDKLSTDLFEPAKGSVAKIEEKNGVSTAK